jgi:hypothetical protein
MTPNSPRQVIMSCGVLASIHAVPPPGAAHTPTNAYPGIFVLVRSHKCQCPRLPALPAYYASSACPRGEHATSVCWACLAMFGLLEMTCMHGCETFQACLTDIVAALSGCRACGMRMMLAFGRSRYQRAVIGGDDMHAWLYSLVI